MPSFPIVLDTNVLISALYSKLGASYKLLSLIDSPKIELSLSVPLLLEYESVLKRSSAKIKLSKSELGNILDYLCSIAKLQKVYYLWRSFLKDPLDDMVLELAVASESKYIVSYNQKDFEGVEKEFGIKVVTAKEFLKVIGEI